MGGWHNTNKDGGDALAVLRLSGATMEHLEATAALTYFPVSDDGPLARLLSSAQEEQARIIVCIDAALAWPDSFVRLAMDAKTARHKFPVQLTDGAINNPYLYRETERYIKKHVMTGNNERPLTAVGDKFGNNSSKAQALVAWLFQKMPTAYRPPFDKWNREIARKARHTILEVYPAASMKSGSFKKMTWPPYSQDMASIGSTDITDAKRCAMTGVCYAAFVGMNSALNGLPPVITPDDVQTDDFDPALLESEGWIFCPRRN